jgi:DNA-binding SARP family transcriptional activator
MRRAELIDDMWPDDSGELGTQRLYEAISSARNVIGGRSAGFDPFVVNRGEGTVALNMGVVSCDVDTFEQYALLSLASEGKDEDVLHNACLALDLYVGEMDAVVSWEIAWLSARARHLCEEFVDAMVTGARSAMRLGRVRLGLKLAQAAAANDREREDVIALLMESLCAAERPGDAIDAFQRYSAHLISSTGVPPSKELRRMAAAIKVPGRGGSDVQQVFEGDWNLQAESGQEPIPETARTSAPNPSHTVI